MFTKWCFESSSTDGVIDTVDYIKFLLYYKLIWNLQDVHYIINNLLSENRSIFISR